MLYNNGTAHLGRFVVQYGSIMSDPVYLYVVTYQVTTYNERNTVARTIEQINTL